MKRQASATSVDVAPARSRGARVRAAEVSLASLVKRHAETRLAISPAVVAYVTRELAAWLARGPHKPIDQTYAAQLSVSTVWVDVRGELRVSPGTSRDSTDDVVYLGCVAYELATLEPLEIVDQAAPRAERCERRIAIAGFPSALADAIERALEHDPERRPLSAVGMVGDLDRAMRFIPGAAVAKAGLASLAQHALRADEPARPRLRAHLDGETELLATVINIAGELPTRRDLELRSRVAPHVRDPATRAARPLRPLRPRPISTLYLHGWRGLVWSWMHALRSPTGRFLIGVAVCIAVGLTLGVVLAPEPAAPEVTPPSSPPHAP